MIVQTIRPERLLGRSVRVDCYDGEAFRLKIQGTAPGTLVGYDEEGFARFVSIETAIISEDGEIYEIGE